MDMRMDGQTQVSSTLHWEGGPGGVPQNLFLVELIIFLWVKSKTLELYDNLFWGNSYDMRNAGGYNEDSGGYNKIQ